MKQQEQLSCVNTTESLLWATFSWRCIAKCFQWCKRWLSFVHLSHSTLRHAIAKSDIIILVCTVWGSCEACCKLFYSASSCLPSCTIWAHIIWLNNNKLNKHSVFSHFFLSMFTWCSHSSVIICNCLCRISLRALNYSLPVHVIGNCFLACS